MATTAYQPKTKPNFIYANISTALVLFLLGAFSLVLLFANDLIRTYLENIEIMVEMKPEADAAANTTFRQYLTNQAFVRTGSLKYTTKEEAATVMRKEFGSDLMAFGNNPLYNNFTFNVTASRANADSMRHIANIIKQNTLVSDVFYRAESIQNIATNMRNIALLTLLLTLVFVFIAANLIHNTVKLSLYSNRFLIKNMQLVGASWDFITRPYLLTSYKNGLISGLLAVAGLGGLIFLLYQQIPAFADFYNPLGIIAICIGILGIGVLISGWSTRRCINKYLRMRLDDLY
jgi:cell division transport system permease protein